MSYKKKTRLLSICLVLVMLLQLLPVNVLGYRAVDLSEAEASPVENTLADSGEDLEYQDSAYQGETEASNHAVRSIAELCELDGVTMDADGGVASICGDQLACITSEELELLQEFSANDEQLLSAEQVANMTLNKYDVSPDQLREAENAYEHQSEYLSELATLTGFEQFREVSAASRAEIVDMICLILFPIQFAQLILHYLGQLLFFVLHIRAKILQGLSANLAVPIIDQPGRAMPARPGWSNEEELKQC